MTDKKEEQYGHEVWYNTNADSPRFVEDIVTLLKETHGDRAYFYALERVVNENNRSEEVELWKAVLTLLDKEK
jgi:hypothetical protein